MITNGYFRNLVNLSRLFKFPANRTKKSANSITATILNEREQFCFR